MTTITTAEARTVAEPGMALTREVGKYLTFKLVDEEYGLEILKVRELIGVKNVGPRAAQNILSGIEPRDLAAAVATGDVARLTKVPGIGKKTAERLVVELKDKLLALAREVGADVVHTHHTGAHNVAILAGVGGGMPPVVSLRPGNMMMLSLPMMANSPNT